MAERSGTKYLGKFGPQVSSFLGFSLLELLIVIAIVLIMAAVSIPMYLRISHSFAIRSNADAIMGLTTVARMRAASNFARAEVVCDASSSTCSIKVATFTGGKTDPSASDFVADLQAPQVVVLAKGVTFGAPSGASTGVGGQNSSAPYQGSSVGKCSYCAIFNSRGLPVGSSVVKGKPVSDYAFYLQDTQYNMAMAVGIDISGKATVYRFDNNVWAKITN